MRPSMGLALLSLASAAVATHSDEPGPEPTARTLTTRPGTVALSPDGRTILTGASDASDGTLTLWDARTGERVRTLTRQAGVVRTVAWSPDGRLLAAAGAGKSVTLWDAKAGRLERTMEGHGEVIHSIAFSPDGKTLASGSSDKTIRLWGVGTGTTIRTLSQPGRRDCAKASLGIPGMVFAVAYSPDGATVGGGGGDGAGRVGELVLWDAETGKGRRRLLGPDEQQVWAVAFSPDGTLLASGAAGGDVKLFDARTGRGRREFRGGDELRALAFSRDGEMLATAIRKDIKLWDVTTGEVHGTLSGHSNWVGSLAISADGKLLVSGGSDGVKVWALVGGPD